MTIGLESFSNGFNGAGIASEAQISALQKALETGYDIGPNQTGGAALRVESLESSLKVLTYTSSHIKFWKKIHKSPAYSTTEEYNELSSYGGQATPWVREGELPQASDSSYARKHKLMKFLGTVREVTHQASVVHPAHGNLIASYNQQGILWLLEQIETGLFYGDSSLAPVGSGREAEQWDGLDSLIDPTCVIDLKGASLQEADFEEASNLVIENWGFPSDAFLGVRAHSDFVKTLYPRQRIQMPAPVNGKAALTVSSIATQGGDIEITPDRFIRKTPTPPAMATSADAPATPTSITGTSGASTLGDFTKGAPTGDNYYAYVVTAANRFGESAPTAVPVSAITISQANKVAGHVINLTITNAAVIGANAPDFFKIYRTRASLSSAVPASLSDYALIAQIPAASVAPNGTTTVVDSNLILPFTSSAYLGEMTESVLTFRQLMPMMKLDLAVMGPAYRWMILLYGAPIMFAPKKWVRFINVGELSTRA